MAASDRRRWTRVVGLLIMAIALGEVAARVADQVRGTDSSVVPLPDESNSTVVPHPYVGFIPRPGRDYAKDPARPWTNDSMGFRSPEVDMPKPPRTFRVACLGDSTTQGTPSIGDSDTWPARLQALLQEQLAPAGPFDRVEVINAGAGFYTSMESFINLKTRLLPLDLDLVIDYDGVNDSQIIMRSGFRPDYTHARRSWTPRPARPLADRLFAWSHLYGMFLDPARRLGPRFMTDRLFVDGYSELPMLKLSEMGPGIEGFYWTLREIVAISRTHGVPVLLMTFTWPRKGKYAPSQWTSSEGYIAVVQQLNVVVRSAAAVERVPLVDLERIGPDLSLQFSDSIHPNALGNDLIARRVAEKVVELGMLTRAPSRPAPPPNVRVSPLSSTPDR
jgi:lysophospholipase L1-like esterase